MHGNQQKGLRILTRRVLIAGAGPAGLCLAAYLTRANIPVCIFEAEGSLPKNLRASTFHPPTLDFLEPFGASKILIDDGLIASTFQYRDREKGCLAEFNFDLISSETNHPFRVQCEQFKLNLYLLDWLSKQGVEDVYFNHRIKGVEQTGDQVAVIADTPNGEQSYKGNLLVGADGANSAVRQLSGISFEGFTWEDRFLVVSTAFDYKKYIKGLSFVNYYADSVQWFFLLKVPGLWRVMFPVQRDETQEDIFSAESIENRMQWVQASSDIFEIAHKTLYNVHQRVATEYRKGRIFLIGDAAHINNPLGGMGMNGGIHDAFNLAEKITYFWHNSEKAYVLDLYEKQRRPIALEYVNKQSIKNKQNLEAKTPEAQAKFREFLAELMEDKQKAREYMLRVSMISSLREVSGIS